jgi:hypothetical protein
MGREAFSIFEVCASFNKVLSVFGFLPIRVEKGIISTRSAHYSSFYFVMYSALWVILCILGQQEPDAEESLLVRYGAYMLYLNSIAFVAFVVLFNYLKRQKIANCLRIMHHFDCTLQVGQMEEIAVFLL